LRPYFFAAPLDTPIAAQFCSMANHASEHITPFTASIQGVHVTRRSSVAPNVGRHCLGQTRTSKKIGAAHGRPGFKSTIDFVS